jgi:hypothetical protein
MVPETIALSPELRGRDAGRIAIEQGGAATVTLVQMDAADAHPKNPTQPETVTEALVFLAEIGYGDEFELGLDGLGKVGAAQLHALSTAQVDYTFRFEGESDPGDEMIVLGVTCGGTARGSIVSAFGPSADPLHAEMLRALVRPPAD